MGLTYTASRRRSRAAPNIVCDRVRNKLVVANLHLARAVAYNVWRSVRGRIDYEDLVSEACEAMIYSAERYHPVVGRDFDKWAYPKVVNHLRDYIRSQLHTRCAEQPTFLPMAADDATPDVGMDPVDRAASMELVARLMKESKGIVRKIFRLRYWQDQTYAEIGLALKMSPNKVSRLHDEGVAAMRERFSMETAE